MYITALNASDVLEDSKSSRQLGERQGVDTLYCIRHTIMKCGALQ